MKTNLLLRTTLAALCFAAISSNELSAEIAYQLVTVGNPGNANDTVTASDGSGLHFGSVVYTYGIGRYEVTLTQYNTFLNAVAAEDPYFLYRSEMVTNGTIKGIQRSGTSGGYTYSVIGDGSRPITHTTWFSAARFANWMHNGQPTGAQGPNTTETGAYSLNGALIGENFLKSSGAKWWIPSENEWYKAAFYDPTLNGGAGGYWRYATRSNVGPGNFVGAMLNQVNYNTSVYCVTQSNVFDTNQNYLTPVGVFTASSSYYGTFDQNGNVSEWNDAIVAVQYRGKRGGGWGVSEPVLQSSHRDGGYPIGISREDGFRLAALPDTDSDGIFDIYETGTGIYVSPTNTGSSPTNPDSDADGLNDGLEVNTYHSNPNLKDSDADGFEDGFEVSTGFDPASSASTPETFSSIHTAVEYRFNAANGISYRIEASTDLQNWTTIETPIIGAGGIVSRLYSIIGQPKRFFRSRRN